MSIHAECRRTVHTSYSVIYAQDITARANISIFDSRPTHVPCVDTRGHGLLVYVFLFLFFPIYYYNFPRAPNRNDVVIILS